MQNFIHNENIQQYRRLIAVAEGDPNRDEARYQVLLGLLAAEVAKDDSQPATGSILPDA